MTIFKQIKKVGKSIVKCVNSTYFYADKGSFSLQLTVIICYFNTYKYTPYIVYIIVGHRIMCKCMQKSYVKEQIKKKKNLVRYVYSAYFYAD